MQGSSILEVVVLISSIKADVNGVPTAAFSMALERKQMALLARETGWWKVTSINKSG